MRLHHIIYRLALLLLLAGTVDTVQAQTLRVGIYQNKPKIFIDENGRPQGILIDLLDTMAQIEGWTLQYIPCEWNDCQAALADGRLDLMPDMAITDARKERFSFHTIPVLHSWLQVYTHDDIRLTSLPEMDGLRVAVLQGSVQEQAVTRMAEGFGLRVTIMPTASFDEAFELVADGKADATIANHFYGDFHRHIYGLTRTPIVFDPSRIYYVTARDKYPEILQAIDSHLSDWQRDPDSPYFFSLAKWLNASPDRSLPRYIWWALGVLGGVTLFALLLSAVFRRQLAARTATLAERNKHLREVLDELNATRLKALEQERLHMLGQMASGIAHDFNNCLTLVLGHSELLRMSMEAGTDTREEILSQLRIIEEAGLDGSAIVQRMRDFYQSRGLSDEAKTISLHALAEDVIELTRPRWNTQALAAGIRIRVRNEMEPVPRIMGSRHELREAILNLVLNAVDAMPKGGDLIFRTGSDQDHVWLAVSDTGIGMSDELQGECMRPFFTTKAGKGTGMGLNMVAVIMDRHRGTVTIDSAEGKGATFTLSFPMLEHAVRNG